MNAPRAYHATTLLSSDQVLDAGGDSNGVVLASSELYSLDNTPPVLSLPANITVNATSPQGAIVNYTVTATDPDNPPSQITISCTPASGSTFPIGTTTVNCSANDPANNMTSGSFTVTVRPVLTLSVQHLQVPEGLVLNRIVATGKAFGTANPLSASINWGDNSSSAGTINLNANGSYSVTGSHSYAEEGSYTLTITVSDSSGKLSATRSRSVTVSDATLRVTRLTVTASGTTVTQKGTFRDADPNGTLTDYSASINWGDGATSAATIGINTGGPGFTTFGSHSYAQHGTYTETITITDAGGSSIVGTVTITV